MPPARRTPATGSRTDTRGTYTVRIWNPRKVVGKRGTTYEMRWLVGGKSRSKSFGNRALADAFRSDLRTAANRGEPFDHETGLPVSMLPDSRDLSWWDWAITFVDLKWPTLAPKSRMSLAEAMCSVTMAMLATDAGQPPAVQLRSAMTRWSFVPPRRNAGKPKPEVAAAVKWLSRSTRRLADLEKPARARSVLIALSTKLDGTPAAATTVARKRAAFYNALEMAVENEHLSANPLARVRWSAPKPSQALDPAVVINPKQAAALLAAVGEVEDGGPLVAFFATMYYAAARPGEALALHLDDVQFPKTEGEWGWLRLSRSNPSVGGLWTDGGRRQERQLKHRARGDIRMVPCAPALAEILRHHVETYGAASDGRLFHGPNEGHVRDDHYLTVWRDARAAALTPSVARSRLAHRPYDLRHACVSTWLAAGVEATQVAAWAGHSVAVLLRVYAHVLHGRDETALTKISSVLSP